MKGIPNFIRWVGGLLFFAWIVWQVTFPSFAWNQKLTLVVQTPSGEVTGSSVSAVRVRMGPNVDGFPKHRR